MRSFRDALKRELVLIDSRASHSGGEQDQRKRRYAIEKMLTNAGGSGVNDRLAAIDKAIKLRSSPTFSAADSQLFVSRAAGPESLRIWRKD